MTAIKALEESLYHWYENLGLAYTGQLDWDDINSIKCPCCQYVKELPYNKDKTLMCRACPLYANMEKTCGWKSWKGETSPWQKVRTCISCGFCAPGKLEKAVVGMIEAVQRAYDRARNLA